MSNEFYEWAWQEGYVVTDPNDYHQLGRPAIGFLTMQSAEETADEAREAGFDVEVIRRGSDWYVIQEEKDR